MRTSLVALALCGMAAVASAKNGAGPGYTWMSTNGAFLVDTVEMTANDGGKFEAGSVTTVQVKGTSTKKILAGTVKYKVYEEYMQYFVDSGNRAYFQCDNKGCYPDEPVALSLSNPDVAPTAFDLTFKYTMPAAHKTAAFRLVLWGSDQDHYPYDFSATINYNFTKTVEAAREAAKAEAEVAKAVAAPAMMPYKSSWDNSFFVLDEVALSSGDGNWAAGTVATVTMTGHVDNKTILAGTIKFKIYEYEVQYFVDSGNVEYFHCDNKGCDTSDPIALNLDNPTDPNSNFTATMQFTMPKAVKSGVFHIVLWGVDQDHSPYDFDATINYNFTMTPEVAAVAAPAPVTTAVAAPEEIPGRIKWSCQNGAFTARGVTLSTPTGTFSAGQTAHLHMSGVTDKVITTGTIKYEIFELFEQHYVASGNAAYFVCDNKGCDPSDPVALRLRDPARKRTYFDIDFDFEMPAKKQGGVYTAVVWGVDQDHTPYDFDLSVGYNYTTSA